MVRKSDIREYEKRFTQEGKRKIAARRKVLAAANKVLIPYATDCLCVSCGGQAQLYHHIDYETKGGMNVAPVCRPCHGQIHQGGGLDLDYSKNPDDWAEDKDSWELRKAIARRRKGKT